MTYTLKLDPQGRYVELTMDGEIHLPELSLLRQQADSLCRQQHIHKLLVDARLVKAHFSALDLYTLASDLAGRESLPGMHYAIVVGNDSPNVDLFGQIARRRGVRVEAFTAYEAARCELVSDGST